jgi:hypothetical protein
VAGQPFRSACGEQRPLAWSPSLEPNNIAATTPYDFGGKNLTPYAPVGTLAYDGRHDAGGILAKLPGGSARLTQP